MKLTKQQINAIEYTFSIQLIPMVKSVIGRMKENTVKQLIDSVNYELNSCHWYDWDIIENYFNPRECNINFDDALGYFVNDIIDILGIGE